MSEIKNFQPLRPFWRSRSLRLMLLLALVGFLFWLRRIYVAGQAPGNSLESSALFRFGASFAGGFFIGWAYRKSLRIAGMIFAGLLALVGLAKWSGLLPLEWDALTQSLHDGFTFFSGEATKAEKFLTGLLPSGVAGLAGVFKGARHK
jgi:uncharacterized membrane protein (Fun14 family)